MEKREQYKRLIMFCASTLIMVIQIGVFAYMWFNKYQHLMLKNYYYRGDYVMIGMYALMLYFFYKLYGGFKVGYLRVFEVVYSQILSVLCVNFIIYLQMSLIGHWKFGENMSLVLQMTGCNMIAVLVWVFFMRWIYARIYPPRQMLMVYGKYSPEDLERKIDNREDKYVICEKIHLSAGLDAIKERILQYKAVVLGDIPVAERNILLKFCFEKNIRCYSIPKISDIMIKSAEQIHLFDTSLLLFRNRGLTIEQQVMKRLMDVVVSLIGLILASPFMLVIAILIKSYDGGPVFYKQPRLTKDGKVFQVLKFRSMCVDSEKAGARLAMKGDSRITPVGRVIRNIHFDELPQIFNILKGDMSLVGPRPERPEIAAQYKREFPEFDFRLKVKAGLTGYAQVYGKYNTTPYDKLKLDLTYIEKYSFMLDIQLLLLTFKILFQKENTEGVEKWQTTAVKSEKTVTEQKQHFVSVIIPAYRCKDTLKQALDSVLKQEVPLEVLVLDDCSGENIREIIESYGDEPRLRYIKNEKNLGAAASRNRGVKLAKGEYVAFLDADDWWAEGKLKAQLERITETKAALCCTGRRLFSHEGNDTGKYIPVKEYVTYRDLLQHNSINCSSVLLKREVALKYPMEHEDSHEDYITWLKILKDGESVCGINKPYLNYRLSSRGKSGSKWQSAGMTFKAYRYMGFGLAKSLLCFISYALHGIWKYR